MVRFTHLHHTPHACQQATLCVYVCTYIPPGHRWGRERRESSGSQCGISPGAGRRPAVGELGGGGGGLGQGRSGRCRWRSVVGRSRGVRWGERRRDAQQSRRGSISGAIPSPPPRARSIWTWTLSVHHRQVHERTSGAARGGGTACSVVGWWRAVAVMSLVLDAAAGGARPPCRVVYFGCVPRASRSVGICDGLSLGVWMPSHALRFKQGSRLRLRTRMRGSAKCGGLKTGLSTAAAGSRARSSRRAAAAGQ